MKKLLVLVAAVVAGAAAVFAGSLNDAFRAVSALPGMKVAENADSVDVAGPEFLDSLEVAYVNGLDGPQIRNVGNRLYDIIETLPMGEMVVGANNGLVAGFVYAEEIEGGGYEVLIVKATGEWGNVSAVYGLTDKATVDMMRQALVVMEGAKLRIEMRRDRKSVV